MSEGFINRPMSIALDLVRAGAAMAVLVGHTARGRLYSGPWPFRDLQHQGVIVFFVLSGLVIATSVERKHLSLRDYATARAARILPVAFFAVVFSLAACAVAATLSPHPPLPSDYGHLAERLALSITFLSESRGGLEPVWDSPYWSLCYEVWYYALFAGMFYLRGRRRALWVAILGLAAGFKILLLLPVWLMGVWLARAGAKHRPTPVGAIACFATASALAVVARLAEEPAARALLAVSGMARPDFKFSLYVLTDLLLGVAVSLALFALRPLADKGARVLLRYERPIRAAAGMSFTLYLLHWPIVLLLGSLSISAGDSVVMFLVLLAGICALCALLASIIERRDFALRRAIVGVLSATRPGWEAEAAAGDGGVRDLPSRLH
jgi:peptidoglycan/LPS O-acetylase OafA/YrhL